MPRYGRPNPIRWRVTLRGELLSHVYADNGLAAGPGNDHHPIIADLADQGVAGTAPLAPAQVGQS